MAPIPKRFETRLVAGIKKFQPILTMAKNKDVNDSDTVVILNDLLAEGWGYLLRPLQHQHLQLSLSRSRNYDVETKS